MSDAGQMLYARVSIMSRTGPTARQIAATDTLFRKACAVAEIPPTRRQASKFMRHIGTAFTKINEAKRQLREEAQGA